MWVLSATTPTRFLVVVTVIRVLLLCLYGFSRSRGVFGHVGKWFRAAIVFSYCVDRFTFRRGCVCVSEFERPAQSRMSARVLFGSRGARLRSLFDGDGDKIGPIWLGFVATIKLTRVQNWLR